MLFFIMKWQVSLLYLLFKINRQQDVHYTVWKEVVLQALNIMLTVFKLILLLSPLSGPLFIDLLLSIIRSLMSQETHFHWSSYRDLLRLPWNSFLGVWCWNKPWKSDWCMQRSICVCVLCREGEDKLPLLSDPRVSLLTNGTIKLSDVSHDDSGAYTCTVKHTNISITAHLEVFSESHAHSPWSSHQLWAGGADELMLLWNLTNNNNNE